MRILLVEDDAMIGESIRKGLRADGMSVDWVQDGRAAQRALGTGVHDLMLLDLGLPRQDGLSTLRSVRREGHRLPILIVTARDAVADRVAGLDGGADDYLVKPFDLEELAARIRALMRRQAGRADPLISLGDLRIDPASKEVWFRGSPLHLSAREFSLLRALADRPGAVLSRAQLEEKVYGWGEEIESNTVEVYIHSLRKKLGQDFIRNVRGVGYTIPRQP
jgi:two-component system, OmpR family, response regulator QseB